MTKTVICCLKAVSDQIKKHRIIPLDDHNKVTIGRTPEATIFIPSPMISRKHVILEKVGSDWVLSDNKSTNGVFINGSKLESETRYTLHENDLLQLRVESGPGQPPDYAWQFLPHCKVKRVKLDQSGQKKPGSKSDNGGDPGVSCSQGSDLTEPGCSQGVKGEEGHSSEPPDNQGDHSSHRQRVSEQARKREGGHCSAEHTGLRDPPTKRKRLVPPKWSPSRDLERRLQESEATAQQKLAEQAERLAELQAQLQQKEKRQEQMMEELRRREEQMAEQLSRQQAELEIQRRRVEEEVKQNYEREIQEKEESLFTRLTQEKTRLVEEKERVERELQQEMTRKLEEQDENLERRLVAEKEKLERVITQKETEQVLLQRELEASRSHHKEQEEQTVLKAKEDVLTNFTELMETELQCSICNELFVQATSLNCSHSFCALCLYRWMKVKRECPVCRAAITSHLRSLVLDSYIDKMAEHLSGEMRQKREALVQERKAELKQLEEADAAPRTPSRRGRAGRGRGRARGRAQGRGEGMRTRSRTPPGAITVESDSSDDDSDHTMNTSSDMEVVSSYMEFESSSDSDSSVEGIDGVYYGGYGSCFRCGRRGHWAGGCPY